MRHHIPLLAVIAVAPFAHAIDASAWRFTQEVSSPTGRLVALDLPDATLDAARADLADLRLTGASGIEIPYVVDTAGFINAREVTRTLPAKNFITRLEGNSTVILLETGLAEPVSGVDLITPAPVFLKPVRIEGSDDGVNWTLIAEGLPIFRQKNGAENLRVNFPAGVRKHLRITVDDAKDDPAPFTGATVSGVPTTLRAVRDERVAVAAKIISRVEKSGVTELRVDLGASNLPLAGLTLDTPEPLFTRRVTVAYERKGEESVERVVVAQGSLWNLAGAGVESSSQKRLAVEATAPSREILVSVFNGDSPPLSVAGVSAERRPRRLIFVAPEGMITLRSGNRSASAPRYDIDLLASKIKTAPATPATAGALTPNPGYKPPSAPAAPAVLAGASIDTTAWAAHKAVTLSGPGTQKLELDLESLCHARRDLGDLRLVADGAQIPYLISPSGRVTKHPVNAVTLSASKVADITRHQLELPAGSPPVVAVDFQTTHPGIFVRKVRLLREESSTRDGLRTEELASGIWRGNPSPDAPGNTCVLNLRAPLAPTREPGERMTLVLEIDNGSDAPVVPLNFRIHTPVTNLLFVAPDKGNLTLYFANASAAAPEYADIRLSANRLLAAPASVATLGRMEGDLTPSATKRYAGPILWASLAAVVAGLLFAVAKMLPKPDGKPPR